MHVTNIIYDTHIIYVIIHKVYHEKEKEKRKEKNGLKVKSLQVKN